MLLYIVDHNIESYCFPAYIDDYDVIRFWHNPRCIGESWRFVRSRRPEGIIEDLIERVGSNIYRFGDIYFQYVERFYRGGLYEGRLKRSFLRTGRLLTYFCRCDVCGFYLYCRI